MSFVFYDTETTGTNRVFDQILQFAAIRTDETLNELESFSIRCRLLPHVVPSPGAMRVTGISVGQLIHAELPTHYEMVRAIRKRLLSWSPSLFIGYNSLGFDEYLLRQAFYQTLHPPYLTNTNGNCRADALRMLRASSLFAPNAITIPVDELGAPSFKLDRMGPANGFEHKAHDALADVQATLHLCRLLSEHLPDLWSSLIRFTQKSAVVDYVASEPVFSLTDFYGGVPYSWLVTSIGLSTSRKSDILVFDLSANPDDLQLLPDDELIARLAQQPKAVRRLRSNCCPIIMPVDLAPDIAIAKAIGAAELDRRARLVKDDAEFARRLIDTFEQMAVPDAVWPHVEQQLYGSFISDDDEIRMEAFHDTSWERRLPILEEIEDVRLKQLGRRLIFLERPDLLSDHVRNKMTVSLAKRLIHTDDAGAWLCLQGAIQEADDLISLGTDEEKHFLREHRSYLARRLAEMMAHLA